MKGFHEKEFVSLLNIVSSLDINFPKICRFLSISKNELPFTSVWIRQTSVKWYFAGGLLQGISRNFAIPKFRVFCKNNRLLEKKQSLNKNELIMLRRLGSKKIPSYMYNTYTVYNGINGMQYSYSVWIPRRRRG